MPVWILVTVLFAWMAPTLRAGQGTEEFIWNEANSRMASARTAPEFLAAARAYERLVARDVRNGPLFYNLGTALLKAGEYGPAIDALLRAERYEGSNPEIQRNLRLAMSRGQRDRSDPLPWYRVPLFWHYGLPAHTRLSVAAAAFSLCWLAHLLRAVAWGRRFAGPLLAFALAAVILFGSSAATSLREEALARSLVATKFRATD